MEQSSRAHILVVDDDAFVRSSLRELLEGEGWQVTLVDGGEQGVAELHAAARAGRRYTLVMTDWAMPGLDGRKAELREAFPQLLPARFGGSATRTRE